MNNRNALTVLTTGCVLIAIAALAPAARANQTNAWAGSPEVPSTWGCFHQNSGEANTTGASGCDAMNGGTGPAWEVALPVAWPQTIKPTITYQQNCNTSETMNCGIYSRTSNGGWYQGTYQVNAPCGLSAYQPGSVYVPSGGYAFAACYMKYGSEWYAITW
jgi:hypothetical protein